MDKESHSQRHDDLLRGSHRRDSGSFGESEEQLDNLLDSILTNSMEKAVREENLEKKIFLVKEEEDINEEPAAAPQKKPEEKDLEEAIMSQIREQEPNIDADTEVIEEEEAEMPEEPQEEPQSVPEKEPEKTTLDTSIMTDDRKPDVSVEDENVKFEPQDEQDNKFTKKDAFSLLVYVALVFALTFLIVHYVGQRTRVSGSSMEDTLSDGDNLIVDKISYRFSDPQRFDIVIFPPRGDEDAYYIKRIIGLPGETVQIDDNGDIHVDGKILDEDFGLDVIDDPGTAKEPVTLGDDEYFVLGDNRNNSTDSRWPTVGAVDRDDIIGRAWVRIYPFDKMKSLLDKD